MSIICEFVHDSYNNKTGFKSHLHDWSWHVVTLSCNKHEIWTILLMAWESTRPPCKVNQALSRSPTRIHVHLPRPYDRLQATATTSVRHSFRKKDSQEIDTQNAKRYIRISTTKAPTPPSHSFQNFMRLLWCYLSHSEQGFPHTHAHTSSLPRHFQYELSCSQKTVSPQDRFFGNPRFRFRRTGCRR